MNKTKKFPKAINEEHYTFLFDSEHLSRASAHIRFRELLRDTLPDDSKYRILKLDDYRYGLYIF